MKNKGIVILTAAVMVILCVTVLVLKGKSADSQTTTSISEAKEAAEEETDAAPAENTAETLETETVKSAETEAGDSLLIPLSEITENAGFYAVDIDGTEMEIIVVRGSDGAVRTAFNTCQICYDSGRGYYVQDGEYFVCQNCGNRFTVDDIGVAAGGCNPWPILEENRNVTEEAVEIPYAFLTEAKELFANWKAGY